MNDTIKPARRISLTTVALLAMVPVFCAMAFAAYLVNRAYTGVDDSTQRLYDTHTEMVFDSMRQVRVLERLLSSGALLLRSDSAALRSELRSELESIRTDGVVQGSEATRQAVSQVFVVIDRCIVTLARTGPRSQATQAAQAACLDEWREPALDLTNIIEAISAQASTSLVRDLDVILLTAENARTQSLIAGGIGIGALLLLFACGFFLIGRPLLRVTRLLARAQRGEQVEPGKVLVREIQLLDDAAISLAHAHSQLQEARSELEQAANTDLLTGLANRRAFSVAGHLECERSQRDKSPVALVCMDIDHFKSINDRFGHEGGDEALRALSAFLKQSVRTIDCAARLGGEEFAILMPRTYLDIAMQVAERLRNHLAQLPITMPDGQALQLTSSFGVTVLHAGEADLQAAMLRADKALYCAKENGRNRVEAAP